MLRALRLLLLPFDDERLSKRLEAQLHDTLAEAGGRVQSFLATGIRYERRKPHEPPQVVTMHFPVPILGLGKMCTLEV
jgi:hypothetical protein